MNKYYSGTISEHAKQSRALYMKQYRETHREALNEYQRQYRKDHPEKLREYNRRYAEKHKDDLKERRKAYAAAYWEKKAIHEKDKEGGSAGGAPDNINTEGSSGESWDQLPDAERIPGGLGLQKAV